MSDTKKHLGDERRVRLEIEKIKETILKSTVVVNWYPHTEDNTVRGPFGRWFTAIGEDVNLASLSRDVEYCALAMTILPNLVNEYEKLQEQNKILREALEFYAENFTTRGLPFWSLHDLIDESDIEETIMPNLGIKICKGGKEQEKHLQRRGIDE